MGGYTRLTKHFIDSSDWREKESLLEKEKKVLGKLNEPKILKLSTHYSLSKGKFANINLDNVYLLPWTYSNQLQLVRFCVVFGFYKYPNSITVSDIRRQYLT